MADKVVVWRGGQVIDGSGDPPLADGSVVVRGALIEAVGPTATVTVPPGATVIDLVGKTIMPGLIDVHLHLMGVMSINPLTWALDPPLQRAMRAALDAWKLIDAGYTTVHDCGSANALYLKRAVAEGSIVGPRIVAAGLAITQTGGHADTHMLPLQWGASNGYGRVADGVAEVRKAARVQLREGADFIKLMTTGGVMSERDQPTASQFSLDEIRAIVDEAHNAGVRTASHAQGTRGIKNALLGGVDSIEHGTFLDDECIELMLRQGAYLVSTLSIVEALVTRGAHFGVPEVNLHKAQAIREHEIRSAQRAHAAGVKIGLGSDYLSDPMSPMGENAAELELFVSCVGYSPMEAIVGATRVNSELLGLQDTIGTLQVGKQADLLVVDGDPLHDIRLLRDRARITTVVRGGAAVPRLGA